MVKKRFVLLNLTDVSKRASEGVKESQDPENDPKKRSRKGRRRGNIQSSFGFEELQLSVDIPDLVEVRLSERGGMGLFTKKGFVQGQRIFAELPFLNIVGVTELKGNPHNEWDSERTALYPDCEASVKIIDAVHSLPPEDKELFWTFSQTSGYGSETTAFGIFYTNYIDVTPPKGKEIGCMYRYISRINHSCQPNVYWSYMEQEHTLIIVATRDLAPGEELLVDYCGHDDSWQGTERRDHLSLFYGFDCRCSICGHAQSGSAA
jgi:hypothetical protein